MFEKIPNYFIKDLLEKTDIVDLIRSRIELKERRKNYNAFCPFHNEKFPSFFVHKEKQFYHCFGCGAHGNAIDFLINYDKFKFVEAVKELASIHNLNIPYEKGNFLYEKKENKKKTFYQLMEYLNCFYQFSLKKPNAEFVRKYLKNRGLTDEVIIRFSIGYAPFKKDNILKYFKNFNNETFQSLIEIGMVVNYRGKIFDRFQKRIIFPIRNEKGKIVGFGGRALDESISPKYLNSSRSNIFCKGNQLYGLYEAKKNNATFQYILVVEGYMDVIALAQYGINCVVSPLGTSTTIKHILLLFRITKHIIFCYDGDHAGKQAAWRTLENALPYINSNRLLQFMFLPNGEDPDSLIRKEGKERFEIRIKEAKPFSNFFFNTLLLKANLSTLEGRAKFVTLTLSLINRIPDEILRIFFRQELKKKIGIFDDKEFDSLIFKKKNPTTVYPVVKIKRTTMHILIGLLLKNPKLAIQVPSLKELDCNKLPGLELFIKLVNTCLSYPNLSTGQLLEVYRDTKEITTLEKLSIWDDIADKNIEKKIFIDSLDHMFNSISKLYQEELIARDRTHGLTKKEKWKFWMLSKKLIK